MTLIKLFVFFFSSTFLHLAYCQEFSESFLKEKALIILKESKTCILTSISDDGAPSSRVMDPYIPHNDFIIYLVTNPKSRKVLEINKDPRVVLTFQNNNNGYVTIKGRVSIIKNPNEKDKFWKDEWTPYYDSKENALLFKVKPISLEIVDSNNGINGNLETWSPQKIIF
jgi:general stress protein 26